MSTDYFLPSDRRVPVARTSWGGAELGCVVSLYRDLPLRRRLVDEAGNPVTFRELLAKAGAGKNRP